MEKEMSMKFRKCFVLREQEIDMASLQKGDIYRLGKASKADTVNDKQYNICEQNAFPIDPPGNCSVVSKVVVLVPCLEIKVTNQLKGEHNVD